MSDPMFEQLISCVEGGHVEQATDALLALSESERRALAPA